MPRLTRTPEAVIAFCRSVWMIELMSLVRGAKIPFIQKGDITRAMDFSREGKEPREAYLSIFKDRI